MKTRYYVSTGILLFLLGIGAVTGITLSTDQNDHTTMKEPGGETETKKAFSHEHQTVEVYHEPDCIHSGYSTYYCSVCDKTYIVTVESSLGHSYDEGNVIEESTCALDGVMEYTCLRCNEKKTEAIKASHNYNYSIVKQPSCIENGIASGATCTVCGYHTDEEFTLLATGHSYTEYCYSAKTPHRLFYKTCSLCGDSQYKNLLVDYEELYGYQHLRDDYENGSDYAVLYKNLYLASKEFLESEKDANSIFVYMDLSSLSEKEIGAVYSQFVRDNPEFYFLDSYTMAANYLNLSIPSAYRKYSSRMEIKKKLDAFNVYAIKNLAGANEKETITNIHNYIRDNVVYDTDEDKLNHSIAGVIQSSSAVCDGYGKSFLYLCYLLGIDSIGVSGTSYEGTSKAGYHFWNYVKCDGKWYGIDVTWDDIDDYYFMWWNLNGKRKEMYLMANKTLMLEKHLMGTSSIEEYQSVSKDTISYKNRFSVALPDLTE